MVLPITFSVFNPQLENPYTQQFTLGFQRQISANVALESAFVGTRGVKFIMHRWMNLPDRFTGLRPNPKLNVNYYVDQSQQTSYVSWQSSLRKRFSHGLTGSVHYTWGKGLSTNGGDVGVYYQGDAFQLTQDFFNLKADRGPSAGDITHYFIGEWVYEVPRLTGLDNAFARQALSGWEVSGILAAQTGDAITVFQPSVLPASRPDYIGGRATLPDYRKTLRFLNPAAFAKVPVNNVSQATIRPGNVGVGAIRGPGMWNVDLGLGKNLSIRERTRLQVRADMFNAFNHTSLAGLNTNINSNLFGQLLSTRGARSIQMRARVTF